MIARYPHTATIKVSEESDDLIPVINQTDEFTVTGRFEPKIENSKVEYSGKFFCKRLSQLENNQQALDGAAFYFQSVKMQIIKAFNYQKHCEIWVD